MGTESILFAIIILAFALSCLLLYVKARTFQTDANDILALTASLAIVGIFFLIAGICNNKPTAIDVYQGKTELEIEYKIINNDTISIDSTVVYKPN